MMKKILFFAIAFNLLQTSTNVAMADEDPGVGFFKDYFFGLAYGLLWDAYKQYQSERALNEAYRSGHRDGVNEGIRNTYESVSGETQPPVVVDADRKASDYLEIDKEPVKSPYRLPQPTTISPELWAVPPSEPMALPPDVKPSDGGGSGGGCRQSSPGDGLKLCHVV